MTEEEARDELEEMTAADMPPELPPDEIQRLLTLSLVGGEYDLNSAAGKGWRIKAGRCFNRINFSADGQQFTASQMFDHCIRMAEQYEQGSMTLMEVDLSRAYGD